MGTKSGELLMGPDFCSKCASLFSDIKDISLGKNTAGKQFFTFRGDRSRFISE